MGTQIGADGQRYEAGSQPTSRIRGLVVPQAGSRLGDPMSAYPTLERASFRARQDRAAEAEGLAAYPTAAPDPEMGDEWMISSDNIHMWHTGTDLRFQVQTKMLVLVSVWSDMTAGLVAGPILHAASAQRTVSFSYATAYETPTVAIQPEGVWQTMVGLDASLPIRPGLQTVVNDGGRWTDFRVDVERVL